MRPRRPLNQRTGCGLCSALLSLAFLTGCPGASDEKGPATKTSAAEEGFMDVVKLLRAEADALVFEDDAGGAVVVSPALQGRIITARVGSIASTGFVNEAAIRAGETGAPFHNFGGIDRFWLGPEAGQYGLYFEPGAELTREAWRVPADLNTGGFDVVNKTEGQVSLAREVHVKNYLGIEFDVRVQREIGLIPASDLSRELGVSKPADVAYVGCYSLNAITNAGDRAWDEGSGLVGIWILGMFQASPKTAVIAPIRQGSDADLGPSFNDDYFGKVSEESPERIQAIGDAVVFKADASRIGKLGLSQKRTTGVAGAYDFTRDLLTIVRFDVPSEPALYGNSQWEKEQAEPYGGDVFQTYNNGVASDPGKLAEEKFFEIESASPVRPLQKNESIRHRHATFHFQGPRAKLVPLVRSALGVELDAVEKALGL